MGRCRGARNVERAVDLNRKSLCGAEFGAKRIGTLAGGKRQNAGIFPGVVTLRYAIC